MRRLAWALLFVASLSLVVAFTVRDSLPVLDTLFYSVPPPVAAVLFVLGGLSLALARRPRWAAASLLAAGLAVALWWPQQFGHATCDESVTRATSARVVFWNAARGRDGWQPVVDALAAQDADLIGLVESGYHTPDPVTFWRRALPGYQVAVPGQGMAILARGRIRLVAVRRLAPRSYFAEATVELPQGTVHLTLVDLEASLFNDRRERLGSLRRALLRRPDRPTVVLGDFNTPARSTGFDGLRTLFTNLWEARGDGYSPTWPLPVPYMTLDQIWLSPTVEPLCARRITNRHSDHALLVGEVRLRAPVTLPGKP